MKHNSQLTKLKHSVLFCFLLVTTSLFSQNSTGVSITWNIATGCQVYSQEIRDGKEPLFIEDILIIKVPLK